jgi:hypothetical protein
MWHKTGVNVTAAIRAREAAMDLDMIGALGMRK